LVAIECPLQDVIRVATNEENMMKTLKTLLVLALLGVLGGCAVVPAPGYYGPPRAYYQPAPVYYGPAVGVGFYGRYR
jgi:hypothetical protein